MSNYETGQTGYDAGYREMTGWVGWIVFAAVILMVNGTFTAIQGLSALLRDNDYWVTSLVMATCSPSTSPGWGWIHLILGILSIFVGYLLLKGSTFARVIGIALVSLNLIAQFAYLPLYPFWGMVGIAVGFFVLYALIVHGGELKALETSTSVARFARSHRSVELVERLPRTPAVRSADPATESGGRCT